MPRKQREPVSTKPIVSQDGARAIREMYFAQSDEITPEQIAERLGCSPMTIKFLLSGRTYKNAGGPIFPEVLDTRGKTWVRVSDEELVARLFPRATHLGQVLGRDDEDEE